MTTISFRENKGGAGELSIARTPFWAEGLPFLGPNMAHFRTNLQQRNIKHFGENAKLHD